MTNDELERILADDYWEFKTIIMAGQLNGMLCAIRPMAFTWGLMVGLDPTGYWFRYCFPDLLHAHAALHDFDGLTDPQGFIVRKGFGADYKPDQADNEGVPLSYVLSLAPKQVSST